jgi:MoaA/NifB/PqqE/SkfB family radical SAM enzyme
VPLSENLSCHKCESASGKLNIKYNGYVFPCEVFKNDRAVNQIGGYLPENIREKTLKDIYLRSAYLDCVRKASQAYALEKHGEACVGQHLIAKENL